MSLPTYQKYRSSGVPWVGDVPAEWQVSPLLGVARERSESNQGMRELNLLSLSYGRIVRKDMSSNDGLLPESYETYQVVHRGDVVFRLTDLQNDKRSLRTAPVSETGIITSAYLAVTPQGIDADYLAYLLRCYDLTKVFYSMGGGLRQSMKYDDVKRLPILVPPLSDQRAITAFLDRETTMIDALIAEQEMLLRLLAEKRQATIAHAVTRGLNPNAPTRDSGIYWLGEVPAHWEEGRVSSVCSFRQGKAHEPFVDDDGRFICVNSRFVSTSGASRKYCTQNLTPAHRNDILMVMSDLPNGRALAKAFLVQDDDPYAVNQRVCALTPFAAEPKFLYYLLDRSPHFLSEDDGMNQTHLSNSSFTQMKIFLPPPDEQRAIAAYADSKTGMFDALSQEAERGIVLLKERRSTLISAAATGKIDVRSVVEMAA